MERVVNVNANYYNYMKKKNEKLTSGGTLNWHPRVRIIKLIIYKLDK